MRKIILTILGLIVSTGAGMALGGNEDFVSRLFAENEVDTNFSGDPTGVQDLGNQADQFKNLYLFMYKNVKEGPAAAGIDAMLLDPDYSGYAKEELEAIAWDGDVSVIADKLGGTPTQSDLTDAYSKITNAYSEELKLQTEHRGLAYESMAQEMFMNGDLSDSAQVDVLYDLDLIHYLLFGDYIEYPNRSGGEAVVLASEEIVSRPVLAKVKRTTDESESVCTVDSELSDAIHTFEESQPEEYASSTASASTTASTTAFTATSATGTETSPAPAQNLDDFVTSISGTAGNWDRPLPCNDIFCITVDLIPGDAGVSTEESDADCIACHVSYILAGLEITLSKPVTPSKVSMNYFEDATCKEAGGKIGLNLNVYPIKKPIFTAPGDKIPDNPSKNVEDLMADIDAARALTSEDQVTGQTQQDINRDRIIGNYEDSTQEEVVNQILAADQAEIDRLNELFDDFEINARGQNAQDFSEQILSELATFKSYFEQFEESLKDSITPLASLAEKEYCE